MTPDRIELHIEELVFEGVAPRDAYRLGAVVERELTRLLAEHDREAFPQQNITVDHLRAGAFHWHADDNAERIGTRVARSLYQSLINAR